MIKIAGRLSFTVSVAAARVGSAFIKPFYRQSNNPLLKLRASSMLVESAKWFDAFPNNFEPKKQVAHVNRHEVIAWTDAAGPSRTIAAVIYASGR